MTLQWQFMVWPIRSWRSARKIRKSHTKNPLRLLTTQHVTSIYLAVANFTFSSLCSFFSRRISYTFSFATHTLPRQFLKRPLGSLDDALYIVACLLVVTASHWLAVGQKPLQNLVERKTGPRRAGIIYLTGSMAVKKSVELAGKYQVTSAIGSQLKLQGHAATRLLYGKLQIAKRQFISLKCLSLSLSFTSSAFFSENFHYKRESFLPAPFLLSYGPLTNNLSCNFLVI